MLVPLRYAPDHLAYGLPQSVEDGLVLVDLVYREAHGGVGLPLAHYLDEDGYAPLFAGLDGPLEGWLYLLRVRDAPAQSAHRLHYPDVVYAVLALRSLVPEIDRKVHVVAQLRLADEAHVGVVEHDEDVGDLVLDGHGYLFHEELE